MNAHPLGQLPNGTGTTINQILAGTLPNGDVQRAYKILGFASTAAVPVVRKPTFGEVIQRVNLLQRRLNIRDANLPDRWNSNSVRRPAKFGRAAEAIGRVLMAVRILTGVELHGWSGGQTGFPRPQYLAVSLKQWRGQNILEYGDQPDPLPLAALSAHLKATRVPGPLLQEWRNAKPAIDTSVRNQRLADRRTLKNNAIYSLTVRFWAYLDTHWGLEALQTQEFAAARPDDDGNSFWWALSSCIFDNEHGLRWRQVKREIACWFHYVITNPAHPKFRTYCQMEAISRLVLPRQYPAAHDHHHYIGGLSLYRSLLSNERDSLLGRNMLATQQICEIVSDFYGREVILFTPNPQGAPMHGTAFRRAIGGNPNAPLNPWDTALIAKVFGCPVAPELGPHPLAWNRCQIMLVQAESLTESILWMPVTVMLDAEHPVNPPPGQRIEPIAPPPLQVTALDIDTSQVPAWMRFHPMPWWPGYIEGPQGAIPAPSTWLPPALMAASLANHAAIAGQVLPDYPSVIQQCPIAPAPLPELGHAWYAAIAPGNPLYAESWNAEVNVPHALLHMPPDGTRRGWDIARPNVVDPPLAAHPTVRMCNGENSDTEPPQPWEDYLMERAYSAMKEAKLQGYGAKQAFPDDGLYNRFFIGEA